MKTLDEYVDLNIFQCDDYYFNDMKIINIHIGVFSEEEAEKYKQKMKEKGKVKYGETIYDVKGFGFMRGSMGYIGSILIHVQKNEIKPTVPLKIIKAIKLSICKGVDLEFVECPDFHDGETFNIFVSRDGKWIYETERTSFYPRDLYIFDNCIESELDKLIEFLKGIER